MISAAILDPDQHVATILGEILTRANGLGDVITLGSWDDLDAALEERSRAVAVLGPNVDASQLSNALAAARQNRGSAFVLVADTLDPTVLQHAMRNGIRDVVTVTDSERDLPAAVVRAHAMSETEARPAPAPATPGRDGKVVAFVGPKGGTGKTTVATNLAVIAARQGLLTALVDGNSGFGDCAAFLKLRPERNFADLEGVRGELDDSVLEGVLTQHDSGLRVLCPPNDPLAEPLDPSAMTRVIDALRRRFDLVFIDTAPTFDARLAAVLEASDLAYLVTSLDLPAVKDAKLALGALERLRIDVSRVRVVLNRADSNVGFPAGEVSKALKHRVAAELPSDIAVPRAVNQGTPVTDAATRSKVAKALRNLAAATIGELRPSESPRQTKSVFARAAKPRLSQT